MKMIISSLAVALGAVSVVPAGAAGLAAKAPIAVVSPVQNVDCRTVERRVERDGVTRITRTRECDDDRRVYRDDRRRYVERRDEHRNRPYIEQPGINLRLGN